MLEPITDYSDPRLQDVLRRIPKSRQAEYDALFELSLREMEFIPLELGREKAKEVHDEFVKDLRGKMLALANAVILDLAQEEMENRAADQRVLHRVLEIAERFDTAWPGVVALVEELYQVSAKAADVMLHYGVTQPGEVGHAQTIAMQAIHAGLNRCDHPSVASQLFAVVHHLAEKVMTAPRDNHKEGSSK